MALGYKKEEGTGIPNRKIWQKRRKRLSAFLTIAKQKGGGERRVKAVGGILTPNKWIFQGLS